MVGTRGHFRVQGSTKDGRTRGGDKRTIPSAFQSWYDKFAVRVLDAESRETLHNRIVQEDLPGMQAEPGNIPPDQDPLQEMREIEGEREQAELEPARWHLPPLEYCQQLLGSDVIELCGNRVQCQRFLPKSVIASISTIIQWLLEQAVNEDLPQEQRDVAILGIILAPKLLWQSPVREGQRLAPHARPREVKRRLLIFCEGRWDELLTPQGNNREGARNIAP